MLAWKMLCYIVAALESHCVTLLPAWKMLCYIVVGLVCHCVTLLLAWGKLLCYIVAGLESHCVTLLQSCSAGGPEESWFQSSLVQPCAVQALGELSVPRSTVFQSQLASRLLLVPLTELRVGSGLGVLSRKEGLQRVPCGPLSLCSMHTPQVVSTGDFFFVLPLA